MGVEEAGEGIGGGSGGPSDEGGLEGAPEPAGADEFALDRSEEGQGEKGDDDGELERLFWAGDEHVRQERDEAAGDVGEGDGEGGAVGTVGGGPFEAKLEAHHEVDPGGGVTFEGFENRRGGGAVDGVLLEDFVDLFFFVAGAVDDFVMLAGEFGGVVLDISAGGEIAAEAHGDGAGRDFGESGDDDDVGSGYTGEAGGEGKRDGEAVGEADDNVPDGFGGFEVGLVVAVVGAGAGLRHDRSIVLRAEEGTDGEVFAMTPRLSPRNNVCYDMLNVRQAGTTMGRVSLWRWVASGIVAAGVALPIGLPTGLLAQMPGGDDSQNGGGRPAFAGGQAVRGTVTATAADKITLKTDAGETYKVAVSSNTRLTKGREPMKLAGVKEGDAIVAMGVLDAPTKTIHAVFATIVDAEQVKKAREGMGKVYIAGKVTSIDELKLTVMRTDNVSQVIEVDEGTSFKRGMRGMAQMMNGGSGVIVMSGGGGGGRPGGGPPPAGAGGGGGVSITLADVKVGDTVVGPGAVKHGVFVPTELGVVDAAAAAAGGQRRRRSADGAPAGAPAAGGAPAADPK